jgi:hypothetical protein
LAEKYVYNSTYAFSENKVTSHRELEGLEAELAIYGLIAKYSAIVSSFSNSSARSAATNLLTNSSTTLQSKTGSNSPATPLDTKGFAKMNDGVVVGGTVSKNAKTLTNEVSKDGLATAKVVGTVIEVAGMGTPVSVVGAAISKTADALDEGRQVAFEDKSATEAGTDIVVGLAIDKAFSSLGDAAKSTVKKTEAGKELFDKAVDGHEFIYSNLTEWAAGQYKESQREKEKK